MARFLSSADVDVYPVGVLRTLIEAWRFRSSRPDYAWRKLRNEKRYLSDCVKGRRWNALRQAFNGYLAESPHWWRCGRGLTPARARRSLNRLMAAGVLPTPR
jgi:hypothetical protein